MACSPSYEDENVPWYMPELTTLEPAARRLLEDYSGIAPDEVLPHVHRLRDKAFAIMKYPCIGEFRFLELHFSKSKPYNDILARIKNGEVLLDLGCCFAQDLRKLVADGASPANLFGSDLQQQFIELGYDLFLDRDKFPDSHFLAADVFADSSALDSLDGKIDIINASSFLHLFDWEQQKKIITGRVMRLLKDKKGSMITGRQVGNYPKGANILRGGQGYMFRHDPESFRAFWKEIGQETGTNWKVAVDFENNSPPVESNRWEWASEGAKLLSYAVWRE